MAKCLICKRRCTSGYSVAGTVPENWNPIPQLPELSYFIDQLAEEIVLSETIPTLPAVLYRGVRQSQVGGLVRFEMR